MSDRMHPLIEWSHVAKCDSKVSSFYKVFYEENGN